MNKELKSRVFDLPQDILNKINHTIVGLQGKHAKGLQRAKKLLNDKKVKYGQLKRIVHDLQTMDKIKDRLKYDLCGGELMDTWSKQYLKGERDLISNRKDSKKRADEIGSIDGERKNSHLKKHKKRFNFRIPTNLVKSNSHKNSISQISSLGSLFEEVEKIKKLITY
jgi:nitrous oxide reductase